MAAGLAELERAAIRLLTSREHSRTELQRKLGLKCQQPDLLAQLIEKLAQQGYQSDARFAEQYADSRKRKGYGPVRIRLELQERGIADELIEHCLDERGSQWQARLGEVRASKFSGPIPTEFKQQAKQARFLEYRGFPAEWVRRYIWSKETF